MNWCSFAPAGALVCLQATGGCAALAPGYRLSHLRCATPSRPGLAFPGYRLSHLRCATPSRPGLRLSRLPSLASSRAQRPLDLGCACPRLPSLAPPVRNALSTWAALVPATVSRTPVRNALSTWLLSFTSAVRNSLFDIRNFLSGCDPFHWALRS